MQRDHSVRLRFNYLKIEQSNIGMFSCFINADCKK